MLFTTGKKWFDDSIKKKSEFEDDIDLGFSLDEAEKIMYK